MPKKILFYLFATLCCGVLIVFFLVTSSQMPNHQKNGFTRLMLFNGTVSEIYSIKLTTPMDHISGIVNNCIYLSNYHPTKIIKVDLQSRRETKLPEQWNQIQPETEILVDSPFSFIFNTNLKWISKQPTNTQILDTSRIFLPLFTHALNISKNKLIIRTYDSTINSIFRIVDYDSKSIINESPVLPDKYRELIQTDGLLCKNRGTSQIFYLQYYQNRFFCLDTNLNIIYTGRTIDTISTNIMWAKKLAGGSVQSGTPPKVINRTCAAEGKYFFVNSNLSADNEDLKSFDDRSVIDVYDCDTGEYNGSFYLPNMNNEKMVKFAVKDNILIALYKTSLAIFKLSL